VTFLKNVHLGEFALQDFLVSSSFLEYNNLNLSLVCVSAPEPRFGCSQVTRGSIKSRGILRVWFSCFDLFTVFSIFFFWSGEVIFFLGSNKISKLDLYLP